MVARGHGRERPGPRARGRADARALPRRAAGQPRLRRDGLGRSVAVRGARVARGAVDRAGARAAAPTPTSSGCGRASRRRGAHGVQCWHGGPRNAVHEYVGPSNAAACLAAQRAELGLVGHTHVAGRLAADAARRAAGEDQPGEPLDIGAGQVAAQPRRGRRARCRRGSAGGTGSTPRPPTARSGCCSTSSARTATWRRAPYDPAPARARARALGLDDAGLPRLVRS